MVPIQVLVKGVWVDTSIPLIKRGQAYHFKVGGMEWGPTLFAKFNPVIIEHPEDKNQYVWSLDDFVSPLKDAIGRKR